MAVFQVKASGSKTTGASTAEDWSDANCYGSIQTALNQTAANDTVILDDGDWVVSSDIVSTSLAYGGHVTIRSRSLNPTLCSLKSSSATIGIFRTLNTTNSQDFLLRGFTLGKTVTHTGNSAAPIWQAAQQTGHIRLKDCIIEGIVYDSNRNGAGGLIHQASAASNKSLTLEDCIFRNNQHFNSVSTSYLATCNAGHTFRVIGTLTIQRVTATGINFGGIYCNGPIDIQGDIIVEDVNVKGSGSTVAALVKPTGSDPCVITGTVYGRRITATHSTARACLLDMNGPHTINKIDAEDCVSIASTDTAGLGAAYVCATDNGVGVINEINVRRCRSNYGPVAYFSQGGKATVKRVIGHDNVCYSGTFYKGGWDSALVECMEILRSSHPVHPDALPAEAIRGGLAVYCHAQSAATEPSALTINNLTVHDCDTPLPPVHVRSVSTSHPSTLTINNMISNTPKSAKECVMSTSGSMTANLVLNKAVMPGGLAAVDITSWAGGTNNLTTANVMAIDPEFDADGYPRAAALIGTGNPIAGVGRRDARGVPFGNPPSIGAREIARHRVAVS